MENIRSLESTSIDEIYTAWQAAFAGYEKIWTQPELEADLLRRGFDASISFGAFERDRLLAFVLNGTGNFNGLPTAYDTGTGATPEARDRGLTRKIIEASLPYLKGAGVVKYMLEVMQRNTTAIKIYQALGFRISRELAYFIQDVGSLHNYERQLPSGILLRPISVYNVDGAQKMWDFTPTWQNSFEAILRVASGFIAIGALKDEQMIGYGIIEASSGDIPQLAADPTFRRLGIGTAILTALLEQNEKTTVKLINMNISCESLIGFLASRGIQVKGRQYEMILDIA